MNTIKIITAVVLTGFGLHATSSSATTYEIDVYVAGLPVFTDCMTLYADGELGFARDTIRLHWTTDATVPGGFIATTPGDDRGSSFVRLALHGQLINGRIVEGNAINGHGLTYTFTGKMAPKCTAHAVSRYPGASEYGALPLIDERPTPQVESTVPAARRRGQAGNVLTEWQGGNAAIPPYDCFGFDCGPPPQPAAATDDNGVAYPLDELTGCANGPCEESARRAGNNETLAYPIDALSGCANGPCVKPPRKGDSVELEDKAFRVLMKSTDGNEIVADCWRFAADGAVRASSNLSMVWNITYLGGHPDPTTFQSVGTSGSLHGGAFRGTTVRLGEIEIAGIRSFRGAITGYTGFGILVPRC